MMKWIISRLIIVPISLIIYSSILWLIVQCRPTLENFKKPLILSFPTSVDDVKKLFNILSVYKENHWTYVLVLFSAGYIYKQTFAIPGSALLNILAGALFGVWPFGIFLCSVLNALGASSCFLLSKYAGKDIIRQRFPAQITWLKEKLIENEAQMFFFLVSLRLFPATPNWLINVVAPIVNIPLSFFFFSVFVGLLPFNFLCLKAGETLSQVQSIEDFTGKHLWVLLGMALAALTISHLAKKMKPKFY